MNKLGVEMKREEVLECIDNAYIAEAREMGYNDKDIETLKASLGESAKCTPMEKLLDFLEMVTKEPKRFKLIAKSHLILLKIGLV